MATLLYSGLKFYVILPACAVLLFMVRIIRIHQIDAIARLVARWAVILVARWAACWVAHLAARRANSTTRTAVQRDRLHRSVNYSLVRDGLSRASPEPITDSPPRHWVD